MKKNTNGEHMTKAQLLHLLANIPDDTIIKIAEDVRTHTYPHGEPIKKVIIENNQVKIIEPPKDMIQRNIVTVFLVSE